MKAFLDNLQRAIDSLERAVANAPTPEIRVELEAIDLQAVLAKATGIQRDC
ncbi:hypothetical protein [Sphingomonas melonis]|uniref:hypothetical protein n=1 Tax=Sphingomonas melonis TaxID=152682 RepID=UPI0003771973|nr:hypothetical protein [Sphingomonas melonis]